MVERDRIEDKLRKKEQEIQGLEDKLRTARIYVQALRDVLRLIDVDESDVNTVQSTLRSGSIVAQAREVLLQEGKPLHINELMDALGKESTRESRASLTGSMAAYVRRGEIFTRPGPNIYGLMELGHYETAAVSHQPPPGFGANPAKIGMAKPTAQPNQIAGESDDDIPF